MSKYNNVNPDHYKVAGRERPGNAVAKAPKQQAERERARWRQRQTAQRTTGRRPTEGARRRG
jgi:hypothetical protein